MKSLFVKACPPLSFFNKVNCGRADSSNNCKRVSGDPKSECSAYVNNLALRQLVSGGIFTSQVNKASLPLMFCVFGRRNPFKIFWPVVQLVTIDVVYGKSRLKPRNKSQGNQTMNEHFWSFVCQLCRNHVVAVLRDPRFYFCLRPNAFKSLRNSKSRSLGFGGYFWTKNSSILGHNPVNAFFMNCYGVHSVNYMAGHR